MTPTATSPPKPWWPAGTGLANATTSYSYFSTGVLASVTYPAYSGSPNPKVTYTYDATGAMASETDWQGNEVTFAHDGDGNPTAQDNNVNGTYPNGTSSTAFSYDAADNATGASSTLAQTCSGATRPCPSRFPGTRGLRNPDGQLTQYAHQLQRLVLGPDCPTSATTATT